MISVCKFAIPSNKTDIMIPCIKILQSVLTDDVVCIYALCDTTIKLKKITVYVTSTNADFEQLTENGYNNVIYLNSIQTNNSAWHVFYELH
jgi:hypothetical protein